MGVCWGKCWGLTLTVLLLTSCSGASEKSSSDQNSTSVVDQSASNQQEDQQEEDNVAADSADPLWIDSTKHDPVSDQSISTAMIRVNGDSFTYEVRVQCEDRGNISYTITSFNKDGSPAPMRTRFYRDASWQHQDGFQISYELRINKNNSFTLSDTKPRFNNQIHIDTNINDIPYFDSFDAFKWASANYVAIKLQLASGDETIEYSQNGNNFIRSVDRCIQKRKIFLKSMNDKASEEIARSNSGNYNVDVQDNQN